MPKAFTHRTHSHGVVQMDRREVSMVSNLRHSLTALTATESSIHQLLYTVNPIRPTRRFENVTSRFLTPVRCRIFSRWRVLGPASGATESLHMGYLLVP